VLPRLRDSRRKRLTYSMFSTSKILRADHRRYMPSARL